MTKNSKHFIFLGAFIIVGFAGLVWLLSKGEDTLPKPGSPKKVVSQDIQKLEDVFAPHKALYSIKLAGTRSGSQIVNISGKMHSQKKISICG